jgi:hypothetical protein
MMKVGPLLAVVPLLAGARWGTFSGFVPEFPVVPVDVTPRRLVGGAATASVFSNGCVLWSARGCGFAMPSGMQPAAKAPRYAPEAYIVFLILMLVEAECRKIRHNIM